jgi:hypothetical protein
VTHSSRLAAALLSALFLALHLPFLPPSLEDFDSINFALGIRNFDVSQHQPHPPGSPLYILAAKAVHAAVGPEVRAHGRAVALTLRGEIEEASTSHVIVRVGDRVAAEFSVGRQFARTTIIPAELLGAGESLVAIESGAWYVPAERRWRARDRRRLALKLYECRITPVS